jgi:hypothetical protein
MTLRLCVILDRDRAPDPGMRRFLAAVSGDARFDLVAVTTAPAPASALPGAVRFALAAEARLFPAPDSAPDAVPATTALDPAMSAGCDVIIDFSHAEAALTHAGSARHGLWRLSAYGEGAGLAEARDRAPVTWVTLWRYSSTAPPEAVASARYDTKFLATRNTAFAREKSVQMILRELARLDLAGSLAAGKPAPVPPRPFASRDLPGYALRTGTKLAARALNAGLARLGGRPGAFFLRLVEGDALNFDPTTGTDLIAPGNAYWADPFLFEHDGALYLFYEEYDYASGLGHLAVGRLEGDRLIPLGAALKRPYHLSYPFVFRWQDDILMIPESNAAGRVEVWRATAFPTEWELASVAFEGIEAADTVVFEHQGAWWLFTNICQDSFGDFGTELHLFAIDGPMLNEITPHPLNPVVIDATTARGGGRVFARDGRLYRTSQDNSHGIYGFGLNLTEITDLSRTSFSERRREHIKPDFEPDIMGCHHMDSAAGRVVIDIRRRQIGARRLRRRQHQNPAS